MPNSGILNQRALRESQSSTINHGQVRRELLPHMRSVLQGHRGCNMAVLGAGKEGLVELELHGDW